MAILSEALGWEAANGLEAAIEYRSMNTKVCLLGAIISRCWLQ
jgi:hypothetical protein